MSRRPKRRVGAVDVVAGVLARVLPRGLEPAIDRARHDARAIADGLAGHRAVVVKSATIEPEPPVPLGSIDPIAELLPREAARRWRGLSRDVSAVLGELRGKRLPALVPRERSTVRHKTGGMTDRKIDGRAGGVATRALVVRQIVRETKDAVSVWLADPSGAPIAFEAGQFLTLHVSVGGTRLRRAYSLCTCPLDESVAICVKRVEGGRVSTWIGQSLREGDTLSVLGPSGSFLAPAPGPRHLVMIAGGSGITPVIAIAETVLRTRPDQQVTLIYGNRSLEDVIFRERLTRLASRFDRLELRHVLEEAPPGFRGTAGRLDRAGVGLELDRIEGELPRTYYLCGPLAMMDAAREELRARGVPEASILLERFSSPQDSLTSVELPRRAVEVALWVRGRSAKVSVEPGQTLLEAGLAAGLPMPFSCAMGGCGACKGRLVEGAVHLEEPNCLSERERAQGLVLPCIARPEAPSVVEVA